MEAKGRISEELWPSTAFSHHQDEGEVDRSCNTLQLACLVSRKTMVACMHSTMDVVNAGIEVAPNQGGIDGTAGCT